MEWFFILLFLVAFLYSSVGHGGASGYLALMAIYGIAPQEMKPTALVLNLFVSLTSFLHYYKGGFFKPRIFIPIALASIPMAFIGGMIHVDSTLYKRILGVFLLFPVLRFFFFKSADDKDLRTASVPVSVAVGASIGLLSGLIGIGGGVILSPLLILMKWTNQKQTAAISAVFIFVNSLAGLGGMVTQGVSFSGNMFLYIAVAFAGGLAGSFAGAKKFTHSSVKYVLATVLLMAAYKLLFTTA